MSCLEAWVNTEDLLELGMENAEQTRRKIHEDLEKEV